MVALNNESTIKFEKHPRDILKATVRYYQAQPQSRGWVEVEAVPPPRDQGECDARTFQREDDEEQQINALICKYNEEIESDITKPMVYFWLEQPKGKKSELRFHFRHSDFFTFKLFIFVKVFHKNKPKTEYVCFPIQKKPRKVRSVCVRVCMRVCVCVCVCAYVSYHVATFVCLSQYVPAHIILTCACIDLIPICACIHLIPICACINLILTCACIHLILICACIHLFIIRAGRWWCFPSDA